MAHTRLTIHRTDDRGRAWLRLEEHVAGARVCEWPLQVDELEVDAETMMVLLAAWLGEGHAPVRSGQARSMPVRAA